MLGNSVMSPCTATTTWYGDRGIQVPPSQARHNFTFKTARYRDKILEPVAIPYLQNLGPNACHTDIITHWTSPPEFGCGDGIVCCESRTNCGVIHARLSSIQSDQQNHIGWLATNAGWGMGQCRLTAKWGYRLVTSMSMGSAHHGNFHPLLISLNTECKKKKIWVANMCWFWMLVQTHTVHWRQRWANANIRRHKGLAGVRWGMMTRAPHTIPRVWLLGNR